MTLDNLQITRPREKAESLFHRVVYLFIVYIVLSIGGSLIVLLGREFFRSAPQFSLWILPAVIVGLCVLALFKRLSSGGVVQAYKTVAALAPAIFFLLILGALAGSILRTAKSFEPLRIIPNAFLLVVSLYIILARPEDKRARALAFAVLALALYMIGAD